jgi:hypothetical protein
VVLQAEVPHITDPRKTPLINITVPEKLDSLTLFAPQDHWSLRGPAMRTAENIASKLLVALGAVTLAWKY